jgi:hypothetical protein
VRDKRARIPTLQHLCIEAVNASSICCKQYMLQALPAQAMPKRAWLESSGS